MDPSPWCITSPSVSFEPVFCDGNWPLCLLCWPNISEVGLFCCSSKSVYGNNVACSVGWVSCMAAEKSGQGPADAVVSDLGHFCGERGELF